jgi:hypothetical protein
MTTADWAKESARVRALRLTICEWRADPVGGRARLIKDIAREHNAPDWMMASVYLRIRPVFQPPALDFQDLDAYTASWCSMLVAGLREHRSTCAKAIRARRRT